MRKAIGGIQHAQRLCDVLVGLHCIQLVFHTIDPCCRLGFKLGFKLDFRLGFRLDFRLDFRLGL